MPPVVERVAVADLDDEARGRALDHERRGVPGGDEVRMDGVREQLAAFFASDLPERLPVVHVASGDVVDEHVEPALFVAHACNERVDLRRHEV